MILSAASQLPGPTQQKGTNDMYDIPKKMMFRTNNPNATISSPGIGVGQKLYHRLKGGTETAIARSWWQTEENARADIPKHTQYFIGEILVGRVFVDCYGNPLTQTDPRFAIRDSKTMRPLLPEASYPHYMAGETTFLTEQDILNIYLACIDAGIPMSWGIVRPVFWEIIGYILCFWPSHAPSYGAACISKLGESVKDFSVFTRDNPFDPSAIWVGMPFLSDWEFDGKHTGLYAVGENRITVVNGGLYDGIAKKPVIFQIYDMLLAARSSLTCQHWAITRLRNRKFISIGQTTAAGKSEGSTSEENIPTPGMLTMEFEAGPNTGQSVSVCISQKNNPLANSNVELDEERGIGTDDISAIMAGANGKANGAEVEPRRFWRDELMKYLPDGTPTVPFAHDCITGQVSGPIDYFNEGWDEEKQLIKPDVHVSVDGSVITNPRRTYPAGSEPNAISSGPDNLLEIDSLVLSVPAPKIPSGWHMPTIVRVNRDEFEANSLHGARSNRDNPAQGAEGEGAWAFEGYGGKKNFGAYTQAERYERDMKLWTGLDPNGSYWIVFNGHSMGGTQKFKYFATYLLRFLMENYWEELHAAPLIPVPGAFTGGVPNINSFLPGEGIDRRLWHPDTLDLERYHRDAGQFDKFCLDAARTLQSQSGHSKASRKRIDGFVEKYVQGFHRPGRKPVRSNIKSLKPVVV